MIINSAEPRGLIRARADIGQRETLGPNDSPRIRAMLKKLRLDWLAGQPWCGSILAEWMLDCGIQPPANAFRAKAWATWGGALTVPVLGCVAVFGRVGGGHVGIVVGQDARGRPMILGGNQGDRVCIAPFDPTRLLAYRWPAGATDPQLPLPLMVSSAASSSDEA